MRLALATCSDYPHLVEDDTPLLLEGLRRQGVAAEAVVWDDPTVDWSAFSAAIVRSTWDYSYRREEFLAWVDRVSTSTQLWNPPDVVRWNSHKRYLKELADLGIPSIPTAWLDRGDAVDLPLLMEQQGWDEVVIKPTVNAGARETLRVNRTQVATGQAHLDRLLPQREMAVQPFLPSILTEGELSLVFLAGEFSHAICKRPAPRDYRIQKKFGGSKVVVTPTAAACRVAEQTLAAIAHPLLYSRVDLVRDRHRWCVIELEAIEPSLYLLQVPNQLETAIAALLGFMQRQSKI
jgi:hypothetical protein